MKYLAHYLNGRSADVAVLLLACSVTFGVLARPSQAAPPTKEIFVVEMTFTLQLNETDPMKSSPQFFTTVPLGGGKQFCICWNYYDQPTYLPGGVQVQVWDNGTLLSVEEIAGSELYINNDIIRWTQRIWLSGGDCHMSLTGLSSATWGNSLAANTVTCPGTGLGNLNNFNIADVVAESGVQHGHQRVVKFSVTEVQSLASEDDKKPIVDTTERIIYATPQ